jgi:hypothetical protein
MVLSSPPIEGSGQPAYYETIKPGPESGSKFSYPDNKGSQPRGVLGKEGYGGSKPSKDDRTTQSNTQSNRGVLASSTLAFQRLTGGGGPKKT